MSALQARARLTVDLAAAASNFRAMRALAGAADCGAAVKADCYGLGLTPVAGALWSAGARDFFVATVQEGLALRVALPNAAIHVLNGVLPFEMDAVLSGGLIPVLNDLGQVALWRAKGGGAPCDLMVDTGINRLGFAPDRLPETGGLSIDIALSHLACADEPDHPSNRRQLELSRALLTVLGARRTSLANSAGLMLGDAYALDLARPGLALYGGNPVPGRDSPVRPVALAEAQIIQLRELPEGASVGYNATWTAARPTRVATLAVGYADGYLRGFSNRGQVWLGGRLCPVIGRVSMDLLTVDVTDAGALAVGDWAELWGRRISLETAAGWSGLSQYELLTTLGARLDRRYEGG